MNDATTTESGGGEVKKGQEFDNNKKKWIERSFLFLSYSGCNESLFFKFSTNKMIYSRV